MCEIRIDDVCQVLNRWAPVELGAAWDNTGLLLGDKSQAISGVMTCLTITPPVVQEAIERAADLIVTHHPLPFRPLSAITTDHYYGRMLWELASHKINVFSLHTRYDSAADGINQQLAEAIGLDAILPLEESGGLQADLIADSTRGGRGRWGCYEAAQPLAEVAERLKRALRVPHLKLIGSETNRISRVAIGCGSAGEFLSDAIRLNCDLLILGETTFHTCLEAEANQVALLLTGHYASERHGMEKLSLRLRAAFPALRHWCSAAETDPIRWL